MPAGFDDCVKQGGKVRTVAGPNKKMNIPAGSYVHVCILKGKVHRGEVKKKEGK